MDKDSITTIRLDEQYENALKEISAKWGDVTSKSDVIRYCIWYTWRHAVLNQPKNK